MLWSRTVKCAKKGKRVVDESGKGRSVLACYESSKIHHTRYPLAVLPTRRHLAQHVIAMATEEELLDLYDIAVLLNYERNTTEPRLRHTKLREVALPGANLATVALTSPLDQGWNQNACTWIVLDQGQTSNLNAIDLPTQFLPSGVTSAMSNEQLETVFHQARNHDGSYQAIGLIQIFFGLFPDNAKLRVRHAPINKQPGVSYMTTTSRRVIIEEAFQNPKFTTAVCVLPINTMYVSGHEPELKHVVVGFSSPDSETVTTFFDLSSMQFGDIGRGPGPKGKELFALDTPDEFALRFSKLAKGTNPSKSKRSLAISGTPVDGWLMEVAQRVKTRWDNRRTEKWCGHCGVPYPKHKCSGTCKEAYYCSREHQKLAWSFHRGYCSVGQNNVN
jgi:hypothetical protein